MNRRSRFEIYIDIMMALTDGPKNPTRLMYKTNLSWVPLQECLQVLLEQGIIAELGENSHRKSFTLTERGRDVVKKYESFLKEMDFLLSKNELLRQKQEISTF